RLDDVEQDLARAQAQVPGPELLEARARAQQRPAAVGEGDRPGPELAVVPAGELGLAVGSGDESLAEAEHPGQDRDRSDRNRDADHRRSASAAAVVGGRGREPRGSLVLVLLAEPREHARAGLGWDLR